MSLSTLLKKYGSGVLSTGVQLSKQERSYFSLGPMSLNIAAGDIRGVPSGRIIQIVGRESTGKSTLASDISRGFIEKYNKPVLYLDIEMSFDPSYAENCGVDLDYMYIAHPDSSEHGFDIVEDWLNGDNTGLVIVDSVAAALASSELDKKSFSDKEKMAASSSIITRVCKRIPPVLYKTDSLIVFINQYRMNMNSMSPEVYVPFGGTALAYATSLRIDLKKTKTEESRLFIDAVVKKSKIGAPMKKAELVIDYGYGINHDIDIIKLCMEYGIVKQSGSWYSYDSEGEVVKVQGIQNVISDSNRDYLYNLLLAEYNKKGI